MHVEQPGADTFLELADTPNSYTSQANKKIIVGAGELGLEFTDSLLSTPPEDLSAQCDGANLVFTTTRSINAILWVNISGGGIIEGLDFTITGDKEITLTFAPSSGNQLFIKYV